MTEGEEHLWHIELDMMRQKVRFAIDRKSTRLNSSH